MPEKGCSRFRKILFQAHDVKEVSINWHLWIQRGRLAQEGHNLLIKGLFPFLVEKKYFQPDSGVKPKCLWVPQQLSTCNRKREREQHLDLLPALKRLWSSLHH